MSTRKTFINSFSWQTANVVSQVVLQLVFIAVIARLIGTEAFGIIGVALAIVGMVEIFSQVGIGPALIQRKDLKQGQINGAFFISVGLGILFTALMLLTGPSIAAYYEYEPLGPILQVIGLSFLISALAVVPKNLIIKQMQFKKLFVAALIAMTIGNLGIGLGLAYSGYGVWAYVFALLSQNLIMTICYWIQNPVKITGFSNWEGTRGMIRYGGGSTLFNIFNYAATKIDTLIVGKFSDLNSVVGEQSSKWGTTGIYDRSVWVMSLPITVLGKLSDSVMFSGLSMLQDEKAKLQRVYLGGSYLISILIIPACAFMIVFAADIVFFLLGYQYHDAIPVVRILFYGVAIRSLIKMSDAVVRALDAVFRASFIKFIFLLMVAAGAYFGLDYGLEGVASSIVAAIVIQYFLITALSVKLLDLSLGKILRKMVPGCLIAIIVGVVSLGVHAIVRALDFNYILVLITAALVNLVMLIALARVAPWLFGKGEDNVIKLIESRIPARFRRK